MKESFLGGRTIALLAVAGSLILLGTEVHAAST
jgi:hypothetical protein